MSLELALECLPLLLLVSGKGEHSLDTEERDTEVSNDCIDNRA